jgi:hypothetical protein
VDLAAVGTARLISNIGFPIEKCAELASQLKEPWRAASARAHILNKDVGADILPETNQDEIDRVWATGAFLRQEQLDPRLRKRLNIANGPLQRGRETAAMREHLAFFDDSGITQVNPLTLISMWGSKAHEFIARGGLESRNVTWAKTLLEFRQLVGSFPTRFAYTEAQIEEDRKAFVEHAKRGVKIESMDTNTDQGKLAFAKALGVDVINPKLSVDESSRRRRIATGAWLTYNKVQKGEFLDQDAQRERDRDRTNSINIK